MRSSSTRPMSPSRRNTSSASRPSYASVTSNRPCCSSFILMMRPMCGSSSATSAWIVLVAFTSDQGRDLFPVASQLEQELSDVRLRLHEDEEDGVGAEHRCDGESVAVLEHGGEQRPALGAGT